MPRPPVSEADQVFAAYLYAKERKTQAEIASELKVSPAVISRILDRVRGIFFDESIRFLSNNLSATTIEDLENRLLAKPISEELNRVSEFAAKRPGPKVRVFRMREKLEPQAAIEQFTKMAAPAVLELLSRAQLCGVTWGRMLASLVRAGRNVPVRQTSTEFVPLAGEPLGFAPTTSSSSLLADELQRLFREHESHARSLTMLPALIPRDFSKEERLVIEKLIERLRDYREIFVSGPDGAAPVAERLDGIITSVGRDPLGFAGGSLLDETEERPLFVGDLGGVLLPKHAADGGGLKTAMDGLADRWKGLRLEHVRKCAAKAAQKNAAPSQIGVVVLSIGASRAPVIFECVKLGLVSHLFIDDSLDQALLDVCTSRSRI
jgi:hypothetical protein